MIDFHKILLCFCVLLTSCKNDVPQRPESLLKTPETQNSDRIKTKLNNPILQQAQDKHNELEKARTADPKLVAAQRAQALSIINHRLKQNSESYAIVEADTWEYQFLHDGEMSKPGEYDGVWIDYKADHTYTYGHYSEIKGSGKYNYHSERSEILMVDDDTSKKPEEWTTKHAGDIMIRVGTATYKDNHIQMKLVRVPDDIQKQS